MISTFYSQLLLAASEGHGKPDPLKFDADLAIFTAIIFIGLLFVLGKYAWGPLLLGLENREKSISDKITDADRANEQAQANLKMYEEKLAGVTDEAKKMMDDAKQESLAARERIISEAEEEAQRIRDRALADIEAAKNAAVRELAEKSVDSAVSLAGTIVGRSLEKQDHDRLIEESISSFTSGA